MPIITKPPKERVREYLQRRIKARTPPDSPAEIRRKLGWRMLHPKKLTRD